MSLVGCGILGSIGRPAKATQSGNLSRLLAPMLRSEENALSVFLISAKNAAHAETVYSKKSCRCCWQMPTVLFKICTSLMLGFHNVVYRSVEKMPSCGVVLPELVRAITRQILRLTTMIMKNMFNSEIMLFPFANGTEINSRTRK